jgi:hypothetical protein
MVLGVFKGSGPENPENHNRLRSVDPRVSHIQSPKKLKATPPQ